MTSVRGGALGLVAVCWLALMPASAAAGYDIAHIIKRSCEPGGDLIVTEAWKSKRDRDRLITEPGEVIGCRRVGVGDRFQIAAGSESIGKRPYLCTYFSLLSRDGADVCLDTQSTRGSALRSLMVLRASPRSPLALAGVVGSDVEAVEVTPSWAGEARTAVTRVGEARAARLGMPRAFGYFSLAVDRRALCADDLPRVIGLDGARRRVVESAVRQSTRLLDETDGVPHSRSLAGLCDTRTASQRGDPPWLAELKNAVRSLIQAMV